MLNNRQAGRRRGRGGQRQQNGGRDNGNRIDNRARGNAPQLLEKYKTLARDAQLAGDRVMTEYYLQFADHYFRVVAESRARFEESRRPRDDWQGDEGEDAEDQGAMEAAEGETEAEDEVDDRAEVGQPRRRDFRERGDRERGERESGDRERNGRSNGFRNRQDAVEGEPPATIDVAVLPPAFGSDGIVAPIIDLDEPQEEAPPPTRRRTRTRRPATEAEAPAEG